MKGTKLRILVVDDDVMMTKTLADIFRMSGYEPCVANSASEALEKLGEGDLDCVLSDIKMPGSNGVELCHHIKARQPELPVVLMTAYSADSLVQEGLAAGVLAIMPKPVDVKGLLGLFASLCSERTGEAARDDAGLRPTLAASRAHRACG